MGTCFFVTLLLDYADLCPGNKPTQLRKRIEADVTVAVKNWRWVGFAQHFQRYPAALPFHEMRIWVVDH